MTGARIYVQINAGVVRTLDQRKIKAALGISNHADGHHQTQSTNAKN